MLLYVMLCYVMLCASWYVALAAVVPFAHAASAIGLADVGLFFFTAYRDNSMILITHRPSVVKRYLRTWFARELLTPGPSAAVLATRNHPP